MYHITFAYYSTGYFCSEKKWTSSSKTFKQIFHVLKFCSSFFSGTEISSVKLSWFWAPTYLLSCCTYIFSYTYIVKQSFSSHLTHMVEPISDSSAPNQTPAKAAGQWTLDMGTVCRMVCLFTPKLMLPVPNFTAWWLRQIYVKNLLEVTLNSAAAEIEPAISNRQSNTKTTTPPSHSEYLLHDNSYNNFQSNLNYACVMQQMRINNCYHFTDQSRLYKQSVEYVGPSNRQQPWSRFNLAGLIAPAYVGTGDAWLMVSFCAFMTSTNIKVKHLQINNKNSQRIEMHNCWYSPHNFS